MTDTAKPSKAQQFYARYKDERQKEKQTERERDAKRKIILGGTAIAAMNADPNFKAQFSVLIHKFVRDSERQYVTEWLPQPPKE